MSIILTIITLLGFGAAFLVGQYFGKDDKERKKHFMKPPVLYIGITLLVCGAATGAFGIQLARMLGLGPFNPRAMMGGGMY